MKYYVKPVANRMGIITSLKRIIGSRRRVACFFTAFLFFLTTVAGTLAINVNSASAQPNNYVPPSQASSYGWINDRTIHAFGNLTAVIINSDDFRLDAANPMVFTDNNPNDTNRTFKAAAPQINYCQQDAVHTIVMGAKPEGATLFYIATPPPNAASNDAVRVQDEGYKIKCEIRSQSIALIGLSDADNDSTDCSTRTGAAEFECEQDKVDGNAAFARACGGPYPNGPLCVASAPPDYAQAPPAAGEGEEDPPNDCDSLGDFSFRWIMCPVLMAGMAFANGADAFLELLLNYDTKIFDESEAAGKNFKAAWNSFRLIGLALLLIVGLIMVVSQALNLQIFDAYMFRKALPRLLIAIIGIALSWEILEFIIILFNDLGHWVQDLVLSPFSNVADPTESNPAATIGGITLAIQLSLVGVGAALITLGPLGIVSVLLTVFLAVMIGLFVLMTRDAIITIAILTAPVAIACWVLPNTKKVWDFWQNALTTALMIFPIIMLFIAAGKALSLITENGFMKVLFLIMPYALLPFAFKLAGGLMQTIFSLANDKGRGAFDRLSNMRRGAVKSRMEDAVQGTGKTWLSKNTGLARGVSGTLGNVYRRGHAIGQYGGFRGGFGATYAASRTGYGMTQVDEALKRDNAGGGSAGGNDDANEIAARRGMTAERFIREYSSLLQRRDGANETEAMKSAKAALGTFESSYGVRMGSDTGRVVAAKALLASNTALKANTTIDGQEQAGGHYARAMETLGGLVTDGLIDESQGAAIFKQNKMRNEFAQVGFGSAMKQIGYAAKQMKNPANRGMGVLPSNEREAAAAGAQTVTQLTREALRGAQPGMLVGGRHETVDALAPEMFNVIQEAADSNDESVIVKELAQTAGLHDSMSQGNRLNADRLDEKLLSKKITGNSRFAGMTVRGAIDALRAENNETFMNRRREYGAAATAQAQAGAAAQPGQGPQPPPVVTPGG